MVISPQKFITCLAFVTLCINLVKCDFFTLSMSMYASQDLSQPILDRSYPGPSPSPSPSPYSSPNYISPTPPPPISSAPSYPALPISPTCPGTPASPSYPGTPASPSYPGTPASPSYPSIPASPSYPGPPDVVSPSPSESPNAKTPAASPAPPPTYPSEPRDIQVIKAAYWPAYNKLNASAIDTTYFTHIYYAFLLLDPITFKLTITPSDQEQIPNFINTLRSRNPPVKTLISIGGADINQTKYFSVMSMDKQTREVFINSTIEIARNYGFDGLDLDWESPANDQEMLNLASLLSEWRNLIDYEAEISGKPRILLSAAVYYSSRFTTYGEPRAYPIQAVNNFLDWINPMCYDYHGAWENFTGPNSNLFDSYSNVSTSYGIGSWIDSGVLPEKIVMGLPLYGRTWTLQDPNVNGIGAKAVGVGPGDGVLSYGEIMEFNNNNIDDKGVVRFDGETVSYYSVSGNSWVGYDDVISVDWKISFARSRGLGGYFFWALGMDPNSTIIKLASNSWDRK
ncbi:class V chitinase CHIT5a-like [Mercurialis annua]|uniref:class V chitinase CHIT5a-like n=1 Tax=Mercurialis annua TaxID=3986 RepID=UPI00215EFECA|nr:class V chitinase CHIT5a-like [Mercurialis annua]